MRKVAIDESPELLVGSNVPLDSSTITEHLSQFECLIWNRSSVTTAMAYADELARSQTCGSFVQNAFDVVAQRRIDP